MNPTIYPLLCFCFVLFSSHYKRKIYDTYCAIRKKLESLFLPKLLILLSGLIPRFKKNISPPSIPSHPHNKFDHISIYDLNKKEKKLFCVNIFCTANKRLFTKDFSSPKTFFFVNCIYCRLL